jgi:hypothetical protein
MRSELRGQVPKLPFAFTATLINRAWRTIRERNLWSFNLYESSWITPPPINGGTVTVTQGFPTITFDTAIAVPAILANQTANPYSLITQRQFRGGTAGGTGGIYNIIALSPNFPSNGIATLDRPYGDPSGSGAAYIIFQNYYAAPFRDHRYWLSVRNPTMFLDMELDMTRAWVDERDPQRTWYQFPTHVIPWGLDNRGAGTDPYANPPAANQSSTYGFPLFELWGVPVTPFTYQCYGLRSGPDLTSPTDTLPFSVGEDCVIALAKYYAYQWGESNKGMGASKADPDYKFLMGAAKAEFKELLTMYRLRDKDFIDNWFSCKGPSLASRSFGYFNTIAGFAGPYAQL